MRGESSYGFVTSMGKMVTGGGLTDSLNVCGSGLSLFFHGVSEMNFLMSSGIIANLRDFMVGVHLVRLGGHNVCYSFGYYELFFPLVHVLWGQVRRSGRK